MEEQATPNSNKREYPATCGVNTPKDVTCHADGSITVLLGRLDVPDANGVILRCPDDTLGADAFINRLMSGSLRGEARTNWLNNEMSRVSDAVTVREKNVSHLIEGIDVEEDAEGGRRVLGRIRPVGPFASGITNAIEAGENIVFGMRALAKIEDGEKVVYDVITWDLIG